MTKSSGMIKLQLTFAYYTDLLYVYKIQMEISFQPLIT